jgi:UDP-2-acetamido-3-amino-2,3-dideoxy-glucuronate N-acetyltransferase
VNIIHLCILLQDKHPNNQSKKINMAVQIHSSAIVDQGAQIGDGSRIWHFSHICAEAKVGKNVSLGQNVFVGNRVVIGDRCKIQNNVSIYDNVTIEEGVFCGPSMVFTNVYNPRALIERKAEYLSTIVRMGASLGANCTIVCGVTIGEFAFVGAGALINKNVKPYALMVGVPAKQIGWMSQFGERIPLPLKGEGSYTCPHTGQSYVLNANGLLQILSPS